MPELLIDTNSVTALSIGHPTALNHLHSLTAADRLTTCFVVVGEWEYGVRNAVGKNRQDEIREAGIPIFASFTVIWDSTPEIAAAYGAIFAGLRKAGQLIPTNDIWIAATAQVYGAAVVTSDAHFRRIPDLNVFDWTVP